MLDDLGLPGLLGIDRTEQLFADRVDLLHGTSALRNPVFVRGNNYTGSAPRIATTPLLRRQILDTLGPELESVPSAILVPLGRAVQDALGILIAEEVIDPERCCLGFPHPSGANAHRARLFAQERDALTETLANWFNTGAYGASDRGPDTSTGQHAPRLSGIDAIVESIDRRLTTLVAERTLLEAARRALSTFPNDSG